ncbi:MAG: hypothetical protein LUD19_03570 [Clostridia bacterium]|nr:hypothetical protein [Clostridia bacterium]
MAVIIFFAGVFIGGIIGFFLFAIITAAADDDEREAKERDKAIEDWLKNKQEGQSNDE